MSIGRLRELHRGLGREIEGRGRAGGLVEDGAPILLDGFAMTPGVSPEEVERRVAEEIERILHKREDVGRRSLISRAAYRTIMGCLHPDRVAGDPKLAKKYTEAFQYFKDLEHVLCVSEAAERDAAKRAETEEAMNEMGRRHRAAREQRAEKRAAAKAKRTAEHAAAP